MKIYYFLYVCTYFSILCINSGNSIKDASAPPLQLRVETRTVEMDNGIVKLILTKPGGLISGVTYGGVANILQEQFSDSDRGYWDITWGMQGKGMSYFDKLPGTSFSIITQTPEVIEVSFAAKWNPSQRNDVVPLNIDKRFILLRGVSGFYTYAIFEHFEGLPALRICEARVAFKLQPKIFHYMAISDEMQRVMPTEEDRKSGRLLDYPEAVLLTNPTNPKLKGEVDDKYQYSCDNEDNHVHGWISSRPSIGFWVITPSDEFRAGGPMKSDLTSHAGPTSLAIFLSTHYVGTEFGVEIGNGERWKKVLGPVFIYLNSAPDNQPSILWQDAKKQMLIEMKKWPYEFPSSRDFAHANQRGAIRGHLLVDNKPAKSAHVGLALPGDAGSWQDNSKGYQFWTRTDENGGFVVGGVRVGVYNLYAWVPGVIGDFKRAGDIVIKPGSDVDLGNVVYNPPQNGPILWEIGIPDRTAAEFYIPNPSPTLVNRLFLNSSERFRQYGLWDRYTDLYPKEDLIYNVGVSNYRKDWFFAHVNRKKNEKTYEPTTWEIHFNLTKVVRSGNYTLRVALASATVADLQVRTNNPNSVSRFSTGVIGKDNAIARHGIHGRYWLFNIDVMGLLLQRGANTIYLRQSKSESPFSGLMYDYIRLEAPSG